MGENVQKFEHEFALKRKKLYGLTLVEKLDENY